MHFAGGFIWFALGGGWTALVWLIGAAVFTKISGGQPLARAAIEMAGLSLSPFGRDAVHIRDLGGQDPAPTTRSACLLCLSLNILWMLTFGLVLSAAYLVLGIACCLTVLSMPLGRQCFRLAGLSLWPIGRRVISTDLATLPGQRAAVARFARLRLRKEGHAERNDRRASTPSAASH